MIQFPAISGLRSRAAGVSRVGYGNVATGWPVSSGLISRQDNPANLISTSSSSLGDPIPRFTLRERSKDSAPLPTVLVLEIHFLSRRTRGTRGRFARRPSRKRTRDTRISTFPNSRDDDAFPRRIFSPGGRISDPNWPGSFPVSSSSIPPSSNSCKISFVRG